MGQAQSDVAADQAQTQQSSSATPSVDSSNTGSSLESLLEEAAAYGDGVDGENESPDAKAQRALECPCIAGLRDGPCGVQFSDAFLCYLKSTAEEKGSDCVNPFVALQNCIKTNPNAFSKEVLEDEEDKKEQEPPTEYKIIPPPWSIYSPSPKSKP